MSLRREKPNRYKRVNKESYFFIFQIICIYFLEKKKQKSKWDVMQHERPNRH